MQKSERKNKTIKNKVNNLEKFFLSYLFYIFLNSFFFFKKTHQNPFSPPNMPEIEDITDSKMKTELNKKKKEKRAEREKKRIQELSNDSQPISDADKLLLEKRKTKNRTRRKAYKLKQKEQNKLDKQQEIAPEVERYVQMIDDTSRDVSKYFEKRRDLKNITSGEFRRQQELHNAQLKGRTIMAGY